MKKRVVVAMSGGVDSSTTAAILVKQGYEVIGINMRLPNMGEASESGCCGIQGIDDARRVAQNLEIPFYALNYEKEFDDKVISYFCREYENGRTPNPCIICNEKLKFGSLLENAKSLGADYIATGHYARIEYDNSNKRYLLKKGKDIEKDQSYFLFSLSQEQLAHSLFPLGDYIKYEVRQLAKEFGLRVYNKPASQEICFIPDNDYCKYLRTQYKMNGFKPGPIVDHSGKVLGKHTGIAFYTIGQRKGIGAYSKPYYVISISKDKNIIVIGEEQELYKDMLVAKNVNWINEKKYETTVKAKIRYKHQESEAVIYSMSNDMANVRFNKPQKAVAPGQAVVFYNDDIVVGGGWIC